MNKNMKILNLAYSEKSEIKFKISKFPDGQQNVTIELFKVKFGLAGLQLPIQIKSRLNNFQDLELIICAIKSLRNLGVKEIHLYTPYFLGSRSDRQFEEGSNNYLKDVICPIINSLDFESITVLKPHSDVLEACLNNFKKEDLSWRLVDNVIHDNIEDKLTEIKLISPDAGSYKWVNTIGREHDLEVIQCYKERDLSTGEIISSKFIGDVTGKNCIILDDLIDGGKSFIEIAKCLREQKAKSIYLVVHHGIFSKGFVELNKYFDGIYCTNSYKDIIDTTFVCGFNSSRTIGDLVKQLNVF